MRSRHGCCGQQRTSSALRGGRRCEMGTRHMPLETISVRGIESGPLVRIREADGCWGEECIYLWCPWCPSPRPFWVVRAAGALGTVSQGHPLWLAILRGAASWASLRPGQSCPLPPRLGMSAASALLPPSAFRNPMKPHVRPCRSSCFRDVAGSKQSPAHGPQVEEKPAALLSEMTMDGVALLVAEAGMALRSPGPSLERKAGGG